MRMGLTAVTILLAGVPAVAQAPPPAGPEFRVNVVTAGDQSAPSAAGDGGRFLVVWSGQDQDGSGSAIVGRRVDAVGAPIGREFLVNEYTTGAQTAPRVAAGPDSFLAVWRSDGQDGASGGVFGRAYSGRAAPIGPEFQINTVTTGDQRQPRVAAIPGGYLVVWETVNAGVSGRVYGLDGQAVSPPFPLPAAPSGLELDPIAAGMPDGGYVVAWKLDNHVMVRRATTSGWAGVEQRADTNVPPPPHGWARDHVALTSDEAGNFMAGWRSIAIIVGDGVRQQEWGFEARRFSASGVPQGSEFRIDESSSSLTPDGTFGTGPPRRTLAAWTSGPGSLFCIPPCPPYVTQDGSGNGVYARWYAEGNAVASEFRVNTYTTGDQSLPSVAADPHGNLLVAWHSAGQDGSGLGVYARRFGALAPAALVVDGAAAGGSDGNRVLEPGETAVVAPAWRNTSGVPQALSGAVSAFTGPAGPAYAVPDPFATYGDLAPDATASCGTQGDCYVVSTSGARPSAHWDAALHEAIAPASLGHGMRWTLHLGDSFSDVARSSPFYRFVETLLHTGVTGGCGADVYCPLAATDRAQMPVFVLAAREGPGYAPPACVNPVFADVPAGGPFCRWIEELARRGVVAGCGGGNYCPGQAVTREQMAVFLLRTLDPALAPPACTTPLFADVPAGSPFCRWIEELARRGIATGCGGGNYCPAAAVTREQMAAFLGATFGLALYGP